MALVDRPLLPTEEDRTEKAVRELLSLPSEQFNFILGSWKKGLHQIWDSPDPQAIFTRLETSGGELVDLSEKTVAFLESIKPGCTADTIAITHSLNIAEDGRVTIAAPEEEE